jgi:hypothetical protein
MQDNKAMWGLIIGSGIFTAVLVGVLFGGPEPDFEVRRLFFAAGVLGVLSFLLVLGIAVLVWGPPAQGGGEAPGKLVFDSLIKVIPPIITLVLGFYLGQSTAGKPASEQQQQRSAIQVQPSSKQGDTVESSSKTAFGAWHNNRYNLLRGET